MNRRIIWDEEKQHFVVSYYSKGRFDEQVAYGPFPSGDYKAIYSMLKREDRRREEEVSEAYECMR